MIGVLAHLQWLTLRGRVVRSIRLLRQPKYLIGALAGLAWIVLWGVRPLFHSTTRFFGAAPWLLSADAAATIHRIAALLLTAGAPLPWLWPWGKLGLPFREAELTMLLQAPLSRRQVVSYGLLKSEAGVLMSAALVSLFAARLPTLGWPATFVGTWGVFELCHLNGKWRALFNLRQTEIPAARAARRRVLLTAGLLAYYAVLLVALAPLPWKISATGIDWPAGLLTLLTPAWWLTAPAFTDRGTIFAAALVPLLALVLGQREIVLRSPGSFEEPALEHARAREVRRSPTRRFTRVSGQARSRRPFELACEGRPETAVLWKNLVRVSRVRWRDLAWSCTAILLAVFLIPALLRLHEVTYGVLAGVGAFLMLAMPLVGGTTWNNDLRTELMHVELVRTWPVSATRFVLAQVAAPALLSFGLSTFGAGLVLAGLFGSRLREVLTGTPTDLHLLPREGLLGLDAGLAAVLFVASCLPVAAALSFLSSALQNLATLVAPAWMAHGADRSQGLAAFGQRLVLSTALALALALAAIPSALLVGLALLVQGLLGSGFSAWEFPLWGALAAAPLLFGGWWLVQLAAPLWERLDPARELLETGR